MYKITKLWYKLISLVPYQLGSSMRKILAVAAAIMTVAPLVGCTVGSHECGTAVQLSTELAPTPNGSMPGNGPVTKTDMYPVQISLAEGVTNPAVVYKSGQLNLGWPGNETEVRVMLPLGDYALSGYTADGKGCTTHFSVKS